MSSAERWRVLLRSRISRIFSRGSVTLSPALRRSLPSIRTLRRHASPGSARMPCMINNTLSSKRTRMRLPSTTAISQCARRAVAVVLLAGLAQSACVYRMPIQQGNFLEPRVVDKLEIGMTRAQVRYLLGTPMVPDTFDTDRWDYFYYLKKGRIASAVQRRLTVFFANDKVARVEKEASDTPPKTDTAPRV